MRRRDASSLLLFLWVIGTFLFSSYINWTTSARNIFPMLPAAAILVIRRINYFNKESQTSIRGQVLWPLFPAALISFLVTWADVSLANSQRSAANTIDVKLSDSQYPVTFQGHWGFQYYMESLGYKAADINGMRLSGDDIVIISLNNTNLFRPRGRIIQTAKIQEQTLGWLSVMRKGWAGFYSSRWGPLPFAIGEVSPDEYIINLVKRGELQKAEEEFKTALKMNPEDPKAHNNLGVVYLKRGELQKAEEKFKMALEISPDMASARRALEKIRKKDDF